jgi:hypothetical protein
MSVYCLLHVSALLKSHRQTIKNKYACIHIRTHTYAHLRIPTSLILILKSFPFTLTKNNFYNIHLLCFNILIYNLDIYTVSANTAQIVCETETSAI